MFDCYNPPAIVWPDAEPLPPFRWDDVFASIGKLYCALWLLNVLWGFVSWQWAWLFPR